MKTRRRARRASWRAQSLVELALVSPVLVVLLLGGAQVGEIAYSQVSLDTAAREGARAGVVAPNAALRWDTAGTVPATHACTTADFAEGATGNPVCIAVVDAAGFLSRGTFTSNPCAPGQGCVSITVLGPAGLSSYRTGQPTVRLTSNSGSPCNSGNQATVNGTVLGVPLGLTASVTDTSGDTQSGVTSAFTLCAAAKGTTTTQTITAQAGLLGCGGYSGSVGPFAVSNGQVYSESILVLPEPVCPTPTPTSIPTPTALPTPTPTPAPSPTPTAGPTTSCASQTVADSDFITVTVSYPVPVFVPVLGDIFQTRTGSRQIQASATYAIEPCTLTLGA